MSKDRNDDNVFSARLEGDDDQVTFEPTTFDPTTFGTITNPPSDPTEIEADFRECSIIGGYDKNGDSDSNTDNNASDDPRSVAPIEFLYSVQLIETSKTSSLSEEGEKVLLTSLSNAIINSIYQKECPVTQEARDAENDSNGKNNNLRRRLDSTSQQTQSSTFSNHHNRQLGIQSISPGSGHRFRGDCYDLGSSSNNITVSNSSQANTIEATGMDYDISLPSCSAIDGIVLIGFDTLGELSNFRAVGLAVLSRIQQDMQSGEYLAQVNRDMEPFKVIVTNMTYMESDFLDIADQEVFAPANSFAWTQPPSGLSTFSKVTIPIIVVLFCLMLCFCWCSYSSYAKLLRKRFAVFYVNNGEDLDSYSDGHAHFEPYRKPKVVETLHQVHSQPNMLSRRSSNMDVPHCSKKECRLCRHQSNHRAVSMIGELSKALGGNEDVSCLNALSLETTCQDISEILNRGYSEDSPYPTPEYSTVPHTSRNLFSSSGNKTPSLIRIVAEDRHNKDGFYNEPEMVTFVKVEKDKTPKQRSTQALKQQQSQPQSSPSTPFGFFSSLFGHDQNKSDNNHFNVSDFACDPRGVQVVHPEECSYDHLDFKSIPVPRSSTMYSYTPSEKSKPERSRTSLSLPTSWVTPFHKANAPNDTDFSKNNKTQKALQRQHSLVDSMVAHDPELVISLTNSTKKKSMRHSMRRERSLDDLRVVPIHVARKRTLTDEWGRVRQEVSL